MCQFATIAKPIYIYGIYIQLCIKISLQVQDNPCTGYCRSRDCGIFLIKMTEYQNKDEVKN